MWAFQNKVIRKKVVSKGWCKESSVLLILSPIVSKHFILPFGALKGTNGACVGGGLVEVGVVALCKRYFYIFRGLFLYCFVICFPICIPMCDPVHVVEI